VTFTLPWPPSMNRYWRNVQGRTLISRDGRAYRDDVYASCAHQIKASRLDGGTGARLRLHITAHPPDKRKRDLDNLLKAPLDAMQHAGVFEDDGLIDDLHITRGLPEKPGRLIVTIAPAPEQTPF